MMSRFADPVAVFVKTVSRGNIQFAADDRLDSILIRMLVEIDRSVEIAMIGHGHGRHLIFLCLSEKIIETNGSVQQAILGMNVKMNEIGMFHIYSSQ